MLYFIQSRVGTYMVNKVLQQITPLTVEMLLLFACGYVGVEFGFSTACLIKTRFTCRKFLPTTQDLMQIRMKDLSANTNGTFQLEVQAQREIKHICQDC